MARLPDSDAETDDTLKEKFPGTVLETMQVSERNQVRDHVLKPKILLLTQVTGVSHSITVKLVSVALQHTCFASVYDWEAEKGRYGLYEASQARLPA